MDGRERAQNLVSEVRSLVWVPKYVVGERQAPFVNPNDTLVAPPPPPPTPNYLRLVLTFPGSSVQVLREAVLRTCKEAEPARVVGDGVV